jgi:hypothetical protein
VLFLVIAITSLEFECCPPFAGSQPSNIDARSQNFNINTFDINDKYHHQHDLDFNFHVVSVSAVWAEVSPLAKSGMQSDNKRNSAVHAPYLSPTTLLVETNSSGITSNNNNNNSNNNTKTTELHTMATDSDSDGLTDFQEVNTFKTSLNKSDSDTDGLSDGKEVKGWPWFAEEQRGCYNASLTNTCQIHKTNPLSPDTDGDRNSDYYEYIVAGSFPSDPDQDKDGVLDGLESGPSAVYHTSFFESDTDKDGLSDGLEVGTAGKDPTKPDNIEGGRAEDDSARAERLKTNDPPIANAIRAVTTKNDPIDIILTGSDSDSDSNRLYFFIATHPLHGKLGNPMVTGSASAKITYTPLPNYAGEDSFTFWAYDGSDYSSSPGRVLVYISP